MTRERFGDVAYRIVEQPARPRRIPRRAAAGAAILIVAAGASALPSLLPGESGAAKPAVLPSWHNAAHMHYGAAGIPPQGNGRLGTGARG